MKHQASDSARSWVVAGACCFINTIFYGITRLSGIFFIATLANYRVDRKTAAFPYSLYIITSNFSGPLIGFMALKIDKQLITVLGPIVAAIGIGLCYFADDIIYLIILLGIVYGFGYAMGNSLLTVIINEHFVKYRTTASGISYFGATLGGFVLPPLTEMLLYTYGLPGTYLVFAGIVLNCIPAAMLLRNPVFEKKELETNSKNSNVEQSSISVENRTKQKDCNEIQCLPIIKSESDVLPISQSSINETSCETIVSFASDTTCHNQGNSEINDSKFSPSGSVFQIQIESNRKVAVKKNFYFTLFTDPFFWLVSITMAFQRFSVLCVVTIYLDFAKDIGIDVSNEKYALMSLQAGEGIGRLGLGWVTDRNFMTTTQFTALGFLIQALSLGILPFSNSFIMFLFMMGLFGLCVAILSNLFPVIIAQFMEEEKQTLANPSTSIMCGPIFLTVAPLIGFFRDDLGSYTGIFILNTIISILCAIVMLGVPWILQRKIST